MLNLQQSDIALVVAADKLSVELTAIVKLDADFLRLIDDVIIGQDVAFGGINDDPGTQPFKRLCRLIGKFITKKLFELFRDFLPLSGGAFDPYAHHGR